MIKTLYEPFRHWSENGSVWMLSDMHLADEKCQMMSPDWIGPDEQIEIINKHVRNNDTFLCLGDVGRAEYIERIHAGKKILLTGNHDKRSEVELYFDEIYTGPLIIAEKILISHEPVFGLKWCVNIHGHVHGGIEEYMDECIHYNVCATVLDYKPVNLGALIKSGIMSEVKSIHRIAIDKAVEELSQKKDEQAQSGRMNTDGVIINTV